MTNRESEILELIENNPMISQKEIADILGITSSSVAVHISNLMNGGFIAGKGYIINDGKFVTVIGGCNMDVHGQSNTIMKIDDSTPGSIVYSDGGAGRNISENLARLNVEVKLLSAVGNDDNGKRIIDNGNKCGIDMSRVKIVKNKNTSTYLSILDENGELIHALSDMSIIDDIDKGYILRFLGHINRSKFVVVDTNIDQDVLDLIFKNVTKPIFVDTVSSTKCVKAYGYEDKIFLLKPNLLEAKTLLDKNIETEDDIFSALKEFLDKGVQNIVITAGKVGVFFANEEGIYKTRASNVKVLNANGAGDSFMAGLIYGFSKGYELKESIEYAYVSAIISMQSDMTINPQINEDLLIKIKNEINLKIVKVG